MEFTIPAVCELTEGVRRVRLNQLFAQNDKLAHTISVRVTEDGDAASLTGLTATGYLIRADASTVIISGTISGNLVTVTLTELCYKIPGLFTIIIKVGDSSHAVPVFWGDGTITMVQTGIMAV